MVAGVFLHDKLSLLTLAYLDKLSLLTLASLDKLSLLTLAYLDKALLLTLTYLDNMSLLTLAYLDSRGLLTLAYVSPIMAMSRFSRRRKTSITKSPQCALPSTANRVTGNSTPYLVL